MREVDILALAGAKGNAATPFAWGSYVSWRLYPNIKISMDGRYETAYPESTFDLNNAFYDPISGRLVPPLPRIQSGLRHPRLADRTLAARELVAAGYVLIWKQDNLSALLCLPEHAPLLQKAAAALPPFTIDPLDLRARTAP